MHALLFRELRLAYPCATQKPGAWPLLDLLFFETKQENCEGSLRTTGVLSPPQRLLAKLSWASEADVITKVTWVWVS